MNQKKKKKNFTIERLTKEGVIGDLLDPFRHFGANPPLYNASKAKMKGDGDVKV